MDTSENTPNDNGMPFTGSVTPPPPAPSATWAPPPAPPTYGAAGHSTSQKDPAAAQSAPATTDERAERHMKWAALAVGLAMLTFLALSTLASIADSDEERSIETLDPTTTTSHLKPRSTVAGLVVESGRAVQGLDSAPDAVVQIVATGEFATLDGFATEGVGAGSGAVISSDGIVVTNNHVVAGAAFLEVYVPGEDHPRSARGHLEGGSTW